MLVWTIENFLHAHTHRHSFSFRTQHSLTPHACFPPPSPNRSFADQTCRIYSDLWVRWMAADTLSLYPNWNNIANFQGSVYTTVTDVSCGTLLVKGGGHDILHLMDVAHILG